MDSGIIRELGGAFNYYNARGDGLAPIWNALAGAALNLYPDPIHLVDFRVQGIYNNGEANEFLSDANSTFRARSLRGAMSVRYLYSAGMVPTLQVSVVGGLSRYFHDGGATSWSGIANGFYNLGADFDVGMQYQLRSDSARLRGALGTPEFGHSLQAVLRFGFELSVNPLPKRDSILNTEHGYIP